VSTRIAVTVAVCLACGVGLSSPCSSQALPPLAGKGLALGQAAPAFWLKDLNGKPLDLAAFRGKVVLLDFWATWCAPCLKEIPHFVDLQNRYRDRGLQVIGISLDDEAAPVRAFYQRLKMNYPVAIGDAALAERYGGILGLPVAFVIGCDGRIRAEHAGETDVSVFERDIVPLLGSPSCKPTTRAR
jgi:cytochrome c biogenesis protein CcmG/thiol:disulfide interchange protein DsbE